MEPLYRMWMDKQSKATLNVCTVFVVCFQQVCVFKAVVLFSRTTSLIWQREAWLISFTVLTKIHKRFAVAFQWLPLFSLFSRLCFLHCYSYAICLLKFMSHLMCVPMWLFVKQDKPGYSQWLNMELAPNADMHDKDWYHFVASRDCRNCLAFIM